MFLQRNLTMDARHRDCGIGPAVLSRVSEIKRSINCCHSDNLFAAFLKPMATSDCLD